MENDKFEMFESYTSDSINDLVCERKKNKATYSLFKVNNENSVDTTDYYLLYK